MNDLLRELVRATRFVGLAVLFELAMIGLFFAAALVVLFGVPLVQGFGVGLVESVFLVATLLLAYVVVGTVVFAPYILRRIRSALRREG